MLTRVQWPEANRGKERGIRSSLCRSPICSPLVALFTAITILVTIIFRANVAAQAGAYATGVLVVMSSAAVAVAVTAWRQENRWVTFISITVVFLSTSVTNIFERPEGRARMPTAARSRSA